MILMIVYFNLVGRSRPKRPYFDKSDHNVKRKFEMKSNIFFVKG